MLQACFVENKPSYVIEMCLSAPCSTIIFPCLAKVCV